MTQMFSERDSGPGQIFIDGREALGITQEQAADSLNLSVRAIKAIENDDADSLPDIVYVNGYIRSYAKLLGIASQPLIDAWRAQHAMPEYEAAQLNTSTGGVKVEAVNVRPMKMGRWALIAVGLSAVFVYFVAFTDDAATSPPAQEVASVSRAGEVGVATVGQDSPVAETTADEPSVTATEVDEVPGIDTAGESKASIDPVVEQGSGPEAQAEEALEASASADESTRASTEQRTEQRTGPRTEGGLQDPAAETVAEAGNLASIADAVATIETSSQAPDEEVAQIDADVFQVESEREVAKAFALPRLTEFGDNTIDLTFSEDCWFEIRTMQGELLYADLGRTGQSRRYLGAAPFRIKLGFSPGAALVYNGKPIDLAPYTRQEVARVLLSEQGAEDVPKAEAPQASNVEEAINSVGAISLW